ncbi:MAG: CPBP family intramembrane glutamic endopeptidase [Bacteroidota bacterium]
MTQGYEILIYSISYLLFFALLWLSKEKKGNRLLDENGLVTNRNMLIVLHIGGILLLGILPGYFFNHHVPIVFGKSVATASFPTELTGLFVILFMIMAPILAEKKYRLVVGNTTVNTSFSIIFIISYFLLRLLFLCAYETWFRGYLLTDCISSFGIPVAIFLNVSLYTLLHIVNGKDEMLACIPFGLLLCSLCIWQGSAWPAIVLHIAFTIPYEVRLVQKIITSSNSSA